MPSEKLATIRKTLGLAKIGSPFAGVIDENTIYRLARSPHSTPKYNYVTVSDNADDAQGADIIKICHPRGARDRLKKKARPGIGLEVLIAPVRKFDGPSTARWFIDLYELYTFCRSSGQQLILSSGAESVQEMVAGSCMDAILESCGIDAEGHWRDMNSWLEQKVTSRAAKF